MAMPWVREETRAIPTRRTRGMLTVLRLTEAGLVRNA